MKINLSKILKFLFIFVLNVFFIFVFQHYFNIKTKMAEMSQELNVAVFLNGNSEDKENIAAQIAEFNKFDIVEYVDSDKSYSKISELNPELSDILPEDTVSFPGYILLNNILADTTEQLENITNELISLDFVEDVAYDSKAFEILFKYKNILFVYQKIFYVVFPVLFALFIVKFIFFLLKNLFKDIALEISYGISAAVFAYALICLLAVVKYNPVFILNWHILYVLVPLSSMLSLVTKESNA